MLTISSARACNPCRQLGVPCDGHLPTCSGCQERNSPCSYTGDPKRRPAMLAPAPTINEGASRIASGPSSSTAANSLSGPQAETNIVDLTGASSPPSIPEALGGTVGTVLQSAERTDPDIAKTSNISCTRCQTGKKKCGRQLPQCSQCASKARECIYFEANKQGHIHRRQQRRASTNLTEETPPPSKSKSKYNADVQRKKPAPQPSDTESSFPAFETPPRGSVSDASQPAANFEDASTLPWSSSRCEECAAGDNACSRELPDCLECVASGVTCVYPGTKHLATNHANTDDAETDQLQAKKSRVKPFSPKNLVPKGLTLPSAGPLENPELLPASIRPIVASTESTVDPQHILTLRPASHFQVLGQILPGDGLSQTVYLDPVPAPDAGSQSRFGKLFPSQVPAKRAAHSPPNSPPVLKKRQPAGLLAPVLVPSYDTSAIYRPFESALADYELETINLASYQAKPHPSESWDASLGDGPHHAMHTELKDAMNGLLTKTFMNEYGPDVFAEARGVFVVQALPTCKAKREDARAIKEQCWAQLHFIIQNAMNVNETPALLHAKDRARWMQPKYAEAEKSYAEKYWDLEERRFRKKKEADKREAEKKEAEKEVEKKKVEEQEAEKVANLAADHSTKDDVDDDGEDEIIDEGVDMEDEDMEAEEEAIRRENEEWMDDEEGDEMEEYE